MNKYPIRSQAKISRKDSLYKEIGNSYYRKIGPRAQAPDEEDSTANVSKVVEAQAQAERVNREHSSWIYKIGQAAFERMIKETTFFR